MTPKFVRFVRLPRPAQVERIAKIIHAYDPWGQDAKWSAVHEENKESYRDMAQRVLATTGIPANVTE